MRPIAECEQRDGETCVDDVAQIWLKLSDQGALDSVRRGDEAISLQHWSADDSIEALKSQMPTVVNAKIGMRDALHIRYQTGQKLVLSDGDRLVGILGDRELYHALLGKAMG